LDGIYAIVPFSVFAWITGIQFKVMIRWLESSYAWNSWRLL